MDFYKSMDNLKDLFKKFLEKVPSFGKSFVCVDDKVNKEIINKINVKNFYTYGISDKSNFQIFDIVQKNFQNSA